jgi:hypothetical protein
MRPDPSHQRYIETLRRMTPEQRLRKAFELYEFGRALFRHGLRKLYPDLSPVSFEALVRERLERCHNRTC